MVNSQSFLANSAGRKGNRRELDLQVKLSVTAVELKEPSWRKKFLPSPRLRGRGYVDPGAESRSNMCTYLSSPETSERIRK